MGKIALITFYIYNYGSLLQGYATKAFLNKNGYDVVPIRRNPVVDERELERSIQRHPQTREDFDRFKASLTKNDSLVPEASIRGMDEFKKNREEVRELTVEELEKAAESDEFDHFIVGSDQVWNTTWGIVPDLYFLRFVPDHKKIALCPSFGSSTVHDYLREDIAEALKGFKNLSSREDEGVALIKELTGRDAVRLSDPSILLTAEEWREFANVSENDEKGYLLLHFLDEPNQTAINNIKHIIKNTGLPVKRFEETHKAFSDIGAQLVTGGPETYIKAVSNAALVCTDSFHTSIFSINLDTDFYTFDRQYAHGVSQISRVITLLKRYGLMDRLILDERMVDIDAMHINVNTEEVKRQERLAISNYLLDGLRH